MPSTMTHSYFAYDIYDKLSDKSKISSIEDLKLYSQGTDPFMFYNYMFGKKNHYYHNIQNCIHTSKTRDYFYNILEYIIDNNYTDDKSLITFLYGNICHYYLDLWVHPFIYYKTGIFNKKDRDTYKYNALHQDMEFSIDRYLIMNRSNIKVNKFKIHDEIFNNYNITSDVLDCFEYVVKKTYGIDNIGKAYKKSVKMMKNFFYFFCYDKFGIKRKIYCFIDMVTPDNVIKIKELSYADNNINMDYLNIEKKEWNHPSIKSEIYNYSFFDLYDNAIKDVLRAIDFINECIDNNYIDINKFNNIFKNLSCTTGKKCNLKLKLKYFEF